MQRTRIAAAMVVVLFLAGCITLGPFGDEQTIDRASVIDRSEETESYTVELSRTRQASGLNETVRINAAVNRSSTAVSLQQTIESNTGSGVRTTESSYYRLDDVEYRNRGGSWERSEADNQQRGEFDYLQEVSRTLEDATLDRIRTERIGGTETTMFRVNTTTEEIDRLVGANESRHPPRVVADAAYYIWVDADEHRIHQIELRAIVTRGVGPLRVTLELRFAGYDEAVAVSLPEGAPREGS